MKDDLVQQRILGRMISVLVCMIMFHAASAGSAVSAEGPGGASSEFSISAGEALQEEDHPVSLIGSDVPDLLKAGLRMSAALILMVGIFLSVSYGIRRWMNHGKQVRGKEPMIRVVASRYFGSKNTLSVIDVQGERFVIGLSPHGIRLITPLHGDGEPEDESEAGSSFSNLLRGRLYER